MGQATVFSTKEATELSRIVREYAPMKLLEVGHWMGDSTIAILDAMPKGATLVSVDHHRGDRWVQSSSWDEFLERVTPHVHPDITFAPVLADVFEWLHTDSSEGFGGFDFILYDADHSEEACGRFADDISRRLASCCVFAIDDRDWESQRGLYDSLMALGFREVTETPIWRCPRMDKSNPDTYTLGVFSRGGGSK